MLTGTDRQEVERFFEHNIGGIFQQRDFSRFPVGMDECKYVVSGLTHSCLDYADGKVFWSVRNWREIQAKLFEKQTRQLSPLENKTLGDQVLFFTGVIRGNQVVSPLSRTRVGDEKTLRDKQNADLYNTGWCCRVGRGFYQSAACSEVLSREESRVLSLLALHFAMWVMVLSRIRQQDILERLSIP